MKRRLLTERFALSLAIVNLFQDRLRFALSVAGVALAIMLVLILNGFLSGMLRQFAAYLDHAPGTIVVSQDDVRNLLGATSLLPGEAEKAVLAIEGVEKAVPILSQFVILDLHSKKQPAYLVGYDPEKGGGPWRLSEGRQPRTDEELVFDSVLAKRHEIETGDRLEVMGRRFTVVGLSEETTSWMTSFLFMRKSAVESLLRAPEQTSFLLVSRSSDVSAGTLLSRLQKISGIEALSKQEMISNDARLFARFFSAPIQLMGAIAFLVGTLVIGLVIYTATIERQREYGTLKAIGARNRVLYRVVASQALAAAGAGAITGIGLALLAARLIMELRPQFLIFFEPSMVAGALGAGLVMALIASIFPARVIARLAPAEVFRK